jgi:hypothetical protein
MKIDGEPEFPQLYDFPKPFIKSVAWNESAFKTVLFVFREFLLPDTCLT